MTVRSQVSKFKDTIHILSNLQQNKITQQPVKESGPDPRLASLRVWQSERLKHTYADLLASRRYGPACEFFLSDIYAARDFDQHNRDIEYLYGIMSRFLPEILLKLVRNAIEINDLTDTLDRALLKELVEELGITDEITAQSYAEAYRICDNYAERVPQIELLLEIGRQVDISTRIPLVEMTLNLARRPARHAGWGELQGFLERGFKAFKHMHGAKVFLNTIQEREMRILDKIYARDPDPFSLL